MNNTNKQSAKKAKKVEPRKAEARKPLGKRAKRSQTLGVMDIVVAVLFIGGLIFAIAAFATANHPMKDSFVLWPLLIGGLIGLVAGFIVWKVTHFESVVFMTMVMFLGGAAIAIGLVLSFNRPLDRSQGEIKTLKVSYQYTEGEEPAKSYFMEIAEKQDFPLKVVKVDKQVYLEITANPSKEHYLAVRVRPGFFGFPYIEETLVPGRAKLPTSAPVK